MSDLDLMPPALPGEKKEKSKGFLKKFFFKDDNKEENKTQQPEDVDLDEIKRKLGLHEEPQAVSPPDDQFKPPSDQTPKPEVKQTEVEQPQEIQSQELPEVEPPKEEEIEIVEQPIPASDATHPSEDWSGEESPEVDEPKKKQTKKEEVHEVESWDAPAEQSADDANSDWANGNDSKEDLQDESSSSAWADQNEPPMASSKKISAVDTTEWDSGELPEVDEPADQEEEQEESPEHHEAVEEHLDNIDKKHHEKAEELLEEEKEHRDIPDWHFHDKEVHPSDYFILKNGHPIRSLRELTDALEYVTDDTLEHHMTEHRNDFANWIREVIGNAELAEAVESSKNREEVLEALKGHRKVAALKVSNHIRKRKSQHRKLESVNKDLEKVTSKLEKKREDLVSLKKKTTSEVKAALDRELENRLQKERDEMQAAIKDLEEGKELYSKRAKECEVLASKLDSREKKLDARESKLKEDQEKIKQSRAEYREEVKSAKELLKEAKSVKKDLEKAKQYRDDANESLKELSKRQAELTRREEAMKKREAKINSDIQHLKEMEREYESAKKEHDRREATVADKEKKADELYKESEKRMKGALDAERKATEKVKQETKKLDEVRKKIEKKLAEVIKNKKKTMYAAELRKHLEESIKETKKAVAKEHEDMEADSFKTYIASKTTTQPAGQPATASEADDVVDVKNLEIFQKVEEARAALNANNLATAKKLYNELRSDFQSVDIPAPERNVLYTNIRELYDDIHLSMLEQ